MATTYTLIASSILSVNTATIVFSNIPNTYTDLVLRTSTRDTNATAATGLIALEFSNINSGYSARWIQGFGSTASSSSNSSAGYLSMNASKGDSDGNTANTFSNSEFYIPYYLSTTRKPISGAFTTEDNSANGGNWASAGLFDSSTGISSFKVYSNSSFASGSSFYLYGIKNS